MKSIALFVSLAIGAGSQPPTPSITLDFIATTDGQPVAGLAPSDVSVKIAGRERPLRSLELLTIDGADKPAAARSPGALPAPFGVTAGVTQSTRRTVLLLVDDGTLFGLDQILKDAVAKLLPSLGPRDRLGLVSTGGVNIPPTTRHETVREAIDGMALGRGNAALCVGTLMGQVHTMAQTLPPGRSSTLAVISRGAGTSGRGVMSSAGNCIFRNDQLRRIAEEIAATQVNYHVFHLGPSGLSPSLDNFAGATGGQTGILSWSESGSLERAISSVRRFYRATIDADPTAREGVHRVELRVSRPNVDARGPSHVSLAPRPGTMVDAAALLRGDAVRADLPLRVAAFPSRNVGPLPVKLVVVVEPGGAGGPLTEAMISVVGADGEVAGQWTARRDDLTRTPMIAAIPVTPGTYRVRAAAVDQGGRGGMAEYELAATLAGSGPVTMSAMVLGTAAQSGFSPRLLFGAEPTASAYMEIYGAPPSAAISVVFELSSSLEGAPVASIPGEVAGAAAGHMVTASIPLGSLPDGDTVVRARITVDGTAAGQVVRTLRKSSR